MHSIIYLLGTTHWQSQWSCSPHRELVDTRHYNNNIIITTKHVINGSLQTEGLILFFYIFSVTHPVDKCFIRVLSRRSSNILHILHNLQILQILQTLKFLHILHLQVPQKPVSASSWVYIPLKGTNCNYELYSWSFSYKSYILFLFILI